MEKSAQIFTKIKHQKKIINIFAYQQFCLILFCLILRGKNYYPQVFLEERKYVVKEKKIHKSLIHDVEISFDSDEETLLEKIHMGKNSDYEENSDEEILEKIQMEKKSDEENSDEENSSE